MDASSRIRCIYVFGMVVMEIVGVNLSDTSKFTCRATNAWGMDEISCDLECVSEKDRVVKPKFTRHLKDLEVPESTSAHFEATLIPVGDPDMRVVWYKDNVPLEPAARIKTTYAIILYFIREIGNKCHVEIRTTLALFDL